MVFVQHIHEAFLGLYTGSKVKQSEAKRRNKNKKEQGNKTTACWRKHGALFNYEKHSFFPLKLNTVYSMW
jgi:hypothetical protein